ncbi:GntR family transcriptional regulator [Streptomyces somaliensis DSM 40738]|uniref:GntR family transcriptional regulator n=2 Tax=Streptomyces somaliensis TaxID=78355 RepID=A0AA44DFL3_STRE0|nr:GntR family transcriptional regulator [Streptomyces somaliensis DSM 40738]
MYLQLASVLRERIQRGDIPVGRRIPSYYELEQETGGTVSRRTVKSAVGCRLVYPGRGTGTPDPGRWRPTNGTT